MGTDQTHLLSEASKCGLEDALYSTFPLKKSHDTFSPPLAIAQATAQTFGQG